MWEINVVMKRKGIDCVGILADQGELQLLQTSMNILYSQMLQSLLKPDFHSRICLSLSEFSPAKNILISFVVSQSPSANT